MFTIDYSSSVWGGLNLNQPNLYMHEWRCWMTYCWGAGDSSCAVQPKSPLAEPVQMSGQPGDTHTGHKHNHRLLPQSPWPGVSSMQTRSFKFNPFWTYTLTMNKLQNDVTKYNVSGNITSVNSQALLGLLEGEWMWSLLAQRRPEFKDSIQAAAPLNDESDWYVCSRDPEVYRSVFYTI